ncbi:MAG TPA: hypothetical protein VG755_13565 [Nannocystaceae bacterium]|nr:hypothetical protein [Nannocystaceae bacterium]
MRWVALLVALAGCTANNPEFGLDGGAGSSGVDAEGSSSLGASQEGNSADESSEGPQGDQCAEPDDRRTHIKLLGSMLGTGATTGSIAMVDGRLHVDCTSKCASAIPGECTPFVFEITPPLWEGWMPPTDCFRFQWAGVPDVIQELRVGAVDDREQLIVLGPEPLSNNLYDVESVQESSCSCEGRECCPDEAGDYAIIVHADMDIMLYDEYPARDDVPWSNATYRVEVGGTSIVPDCEVPKRLQFRAYRSN